MTAQRRAGVRWDALVKVGGSSKRFKIIIVPGGGVFADLVRRERRRLKLREEVAHRMALRGMDQYGLLIASLCPRARVVKTKESAARAARSGKIPVLLASSLIETEPALERTFRLTSDSIAAFLAGHMGARRLILLKSVAVPLGRIRNRTEAATIARRGIVDPLFPRLLPTGITTWIVDGRNPADLERALVIQEDAVERCEGASPRRARRNAVRRSGCRTP
jgi:aspartokinase-like uncharacterized kinase